jgi:Zn-dependent M16 (insulinase) family peptidase
LTREEFVSFYKKYYHPTNAKIFVAGDERDVYHALASVDRYIEPMGYNPASRDDSVINYQPLKFNEPVRDRMPFVAAAASDEVGDDDESGGSGGDGHILCVTWLLNATPMSAMMELAWIVLDGLLLVRPSSPLRKALENSRLGEEIIGGGLSNELLQSTFAIGMKGVKNVGDVSTLETLIMDTLHRLYLDGFNDDEIASTMNTIEFQLREGGGGLRGMEIFLGALTKWNYDLSPIDSLVYEDALKLMKEEIEKRGSEIFKTMISDSLLGNSHRVVMELYPSTTLEEEQKQVRRWQISSAPSAVRKIMYNPPSPPSPQRRIRSYRFLTLSQK